MSNAEDSSIEFLSKKFPELKEDLGLFYLSDQLRMLGAESVITEFEGYRGLTFQVYDHDEILNFVKMEWFPKKNFCSKSHTWYSKSPEEFNVGVYVSELPRVDENYTQEMADSEFFTHLETTGDSAKVILSRSLNFLSNEYGLVLGIHPLRS
jgi:hypothetical protein